MRKPILFTFICLLFLPGGQAWAAVWQGGITIFGRVYLPDGQSTARTKVKVETVNGLVRDVWSDDQGNYEIRGMPAGRYRLSATNPEAAEQFTEPAESDSTRSYANRLQVNLYLRLPTQHGKPAPPGVISVAEAAQNIPKDARKAYEEGMKLQKENQAEKAITAFSQAIDLYPEYFQALTERGNQRMARNQLSEAATDFERALHLNAKFVPALRGLGYCQLQQKQFVEGVANLERAYSLAPNVALTLLLLGYGNLSLNRLEPARQCLQEALRLDKASAARAHVYLGEIFAKEQKFNEAADEIRAYLKANPKAADAASLQKMEADWRDRGKGAPKQR